MVKIRLKRLGAKKAPFYHIVVADSRSPRDGKIIEQVGTYNPMTTPSTITVDTEKVATWIKNGAKPTDRVKSLIEIASKVAEPVKTGKVAKVAKTEKTAE